MALLNKEQGQLTRYYIKELKNAADTAPSVVPEIIDYLDGGALNQILTFMAERYATEIVREKTETGGERTYQAKTKAAAKAAIDNKLFEVVETGTFTRIVDILNVVSRGLEFEYSVDAEEAEEAAQAEVEVDPITGEPLEATPEEPEEADPVEEFATDLEEERQRGEFELMLGRVDELAVGVGSSAMLVQVLGSKMSYQPIPRHQIWVCFSDTIQEDGEDRPTNTLDIEEASAVIIQLSDGQFAAYFPRQVDVKDDGTVVEKYPQGRFVKYWSDNWYDVPEVGTQGEFTDYMDGEEIANPLTLWQDQQQDWSSPEIPVTLWRGTINGIGAELMPIDSSLYDQCKEFDLAASRILNAGVKSARGVYVVSREEGASPVFSSNIDEGVALLQPGQSMVATYVPGANSKTAMEIVETQVAMTAESRGVPAYQLSLSTNTNFPSGTALVEANKPKSEKRMARVEINRAGMDRIYKTELSLIGMENGAPVGQGVKQTWLYKPESISMTDLDVLTLEEKKKAIGLTDEAQILVDTDERFETREQAEEYLAKLKKSTPAPNGGLAAVQAAAKQRRAVNNAGLLQAAGVPVQ
jgi:hypothetical protein